MHSVIIVKDQTLHKKK